MLRVIHPLNVEGHLRLVPTFLGAHEIPDEYRGKKDYVNIVIDEMLPAVAHARLAEYCDVFCETNIFNSQATLRIPAVARALKLGIRIHADQVACSSAVDAETGATTTDHLKQIDARRIEALAKAGV